MQKLLIATKNPSKTREFAEWLQRMRISFATLAEFPDVPDVEETGNTFEENAKLKAAYYFERLGLPTIADDGGIEIDALGGLPGVKSRRWIHGDRESSDEELVSYTLRSLEGVADTARTARFRSVVSCFDGHEYICGTGTIEGVVAHEATTYTPGFPYRGLLFIPQFGKMYDALSHEEHEMVNHRRLALEQLREELVQKYGGVA